jgi:hypothetical protein
MANRRSKDFKGAMEGVSFFITVSRPTQHQRHFTIRATLVAEATSGGTGQPFEVALAHGLALQDMEATSVVSALGTTGDTGAYGLCYTGSLTIHRERAEGMVRTFKIVEDGLGRLEDQFGAPTTFGQYMARLSKVLGVKKFLFPAQAAGSSAAASVEVREAISRIDMLSKQLSSEQRGGTTHHDSV